MPTLTVTPDGVKVELLDGETVLEGLYRHGYAYRIGCRRGGCAICMVDLLDGQVQYNRPVAEKVLNDEQRASGSCLSCRAVALTDITIALREDTLRRVNPFTAMFAAEKPTG